MRIVHCVFGWIYVAAAGAAAVTAMALASVVAVPGTIAFAVAAVAMAHVYVFLSVLTAEAAETRGYRHGDFLIFSLIASPVLAFVILFVLGIVRPQGPRRHRDSA